MTCTGGEESRRRRAHYAYLVPCVRVVACGVVDVRMMIHFASARVITSVLFTVRARVLACAC